MHGIRNDVYNYYFNMREVVGKFIVIMILCFLPGKGVAASNSADNLFTCWSCYGFSPFLIFGEKYAGGLEVNRWAPQFYDDYPKDSTGRRIGPNDIKPVWFGWGFRFNGGNYLDGLYFSPYFLLGAPIGLTGLEIGPELGYSDDKIDAGASLRVWALCGGFEIMTTIHNSFRIGVYVFIPIYSPLIGLT